MAETCKDEHCPKHGLVKVHGRAFTATVQSARAQKTAIVDWERRYHVPKYERYERRRTKLNVHNPGCLNVKAGDIVRIIECKPISKTKHFVIVERLGQDILFAQKQELKAEGKIKQDVKEGEE